MENCGIYSIINKVTGKIYIGNSVNIDIRCKSHLYRLKKQIHKNSHLQTSYNKYGKENFIYNIVELCSIENLEERELYWINTLNTLNPEKGYNMVLPGGSNLGYKQGVRTIEKKTRLANKRVDQYSKNGELIKTWNSIKEAANNIGIHSTGITHCCKGNRQGAAGGYVWRIQGESFEKYINKFKIK